MKSLIVESVGRGLFPLEIRIFDTSPGSNPDNPVATVTLNADGSFHYVPQAGFHGWDVFSYSASDGRLDSVRPALVVITIP